MNAEQWVTMSVAHLSGEDRTLRLKDIAEGALFEVTREAAFRVLAREGHEIMFPEAP